LWDPDGPGPSDPSSKVPHSSIDLLDMLHCGRGAGSLSNTKLPGLRPISIPSGILIHPAIWPQQIWAENWGAPPPLGEGELGARIIGQNCVRSTAVRRAMEFRLWRLGTLCGDHAMVVGLWQNVHLYDIVLESSRSLSHLLMLLSININAITYAVSLPNR